jgi:NADH-quinone oxidoreductase subunit C
MVAEQITSVLKSAFGDAIVEFVTTGLHPHAVVAAGRWHDVAMFLRDDPRFRFNMLRAVSGVDRQAQNELEAVYELIAMAPAEGGPDGFWTARHTLAVKVRTDRADPHIPSVSDVWPAADWHERETYDLVGIVFDGHPDSVEDEAGRHPRRILCPDDWEGHALRKDYVAPDEYWGIPGTSDVDASKPSGTQ